MERGKEDCHIHMVLDGENWKTAIKRHENGPDRQWILEILEQYARAGYDYLRDGGDRWGVGAAARSLAGEYGIRYRTPLAPLYHKGHYGGFIGIGFENIREYRELVCKNQERDFVKIMISGLMDFDRFGVLTQPGLTAGEIWELVHIAHEEGYAVMAHANGAEVVRAAAEAGVDSVEHGAYLDGEALQAMAENDTVWVPTLSTIGNLRGRGRFNEAAVAKILESAMKNVTEFAAMGGAGGRGQRCRGLGGPPCRRNGESTAHACPGGKCRSGSAPGRGENQGEILSGTLRSTFLEREKIRVQEKRPLDKLTGHCYNGQSIGKPMSKRSNRKSNLSESRGRWDHGRRLSGEWTCEGGANALCQ